MRSGSSSHSVDGYASGVGGLSIPIALFARLSLRDVKIRELEPTAWPRSRWVNCEHDEVALSRKKRKAVDTDDTGSTNDKGPLSLRGGFDPPPSRGARRSLADTPHGQDGGAAPEPEPDDSPHVQDQSANRNLDGNDGYDVDNEGNEEGNGALLEGAAGNADDGDVGFDALVQAAAAAEHLQDQGSNGAPLESAAFIGPSPTPVSSDIQMFSIGYHGDRSDIGVTFNIKTWGGLRVFAVNTVSEGGPFHGILQAGDVIMAINEKAVPGTIKEGVPLTTQVDLFMLMMQNATRSLLLLCQRLGSNTNFQLEDVTADDATSTTQSSTRQTNLSDFPIGLPVRVDDAVLGDVEGVVGRTLDDGTVVVIPDSMSFGRNIEVDHLNHDRITNLRGDRMDAKQAAYDAKQEEINAQNRAPQRQNRRRSNRDETEVRIECASRGLAHQRYCKKSRKLKADRDLLVPRQPVHPFHDPPYFIDNPLTERMKMPESEFSISSALEFVGDGYDLSRLPDMINEGDEVLSDEPIIDMNFVHDNEGYEERRNGRTRALVYGNLYYFRHDHTERPERPENDEVDENDDVDEAGAVDEVGECNVGTCVRTRCSGMIRRFAPSLDEEFQEVSGAHRIVHSHSSECQVRWLVENRLRLDLSDDHVESVLNWHIKVVAGWISHPILVSL